MDQRLMECPVCLSPYEGKIFLCKNCHSLCENCSKVIKSCPKCNAPMTTNRCYDMEALIDGLKSKLKLSCPNKNCPYTLTPDKQSAHQTECKYRTHLCQAARFCGAKCNWMGDFDELLQHYKTTHPDRARMETYVKNVVLDWKFEDRKDVHVLSYLSGKQLFYYKLKISTAAQKAYWLFQFVGPAKEAHNYTYEFEINKDSRKYKINGLCAGDTEDVEELFDSEDCVCLSFKQLLHYVNDKNELSLRFRIGNVNHVPVVTGKGAEIKKIPAGQPQTFQTHFQTRMNFVPAVQRTNYVPIMPQPNMYFVGAPLNAARPGLPVNVKPKKKP